MQITWKEDWSYAHTSWSPKTIGKIKNNEGHQVQIKSITLSLGKAGNVTVGKNQGGSVTATGNNQNISVYIKCGSKTSNTQTVTNRADGGSYQWPKQSSCKSYTFTFSDFVMNNNASVDIVLCWNTNTLIRNKPSHSVSWEEYNPYTKSKINSSSIDAQIIRVDVTKFHVNFNVSAGNKMWNTEVKAYTWDSTGTVAFGNLVLHRTRDCKEKQNTTFNESFEITAGSSEMSNGSRYKVKAIVADVDRSKNPEQWWAAVGAPNGDDIQTGWSLYTYQEPKLNGDTISIGEKPANMSYTFSLSGTNNRAWSDYESEFQTRYRISFDNGSSWSSWTNIGNKTSWARTASEMRSLFPKGHDGDYARIQFKRYSPSAPDSTDTDTNHSNNKGWYSSNTKEYTITFKYRPRNAITCPNVGQRKNNSSGASISKDGFVENNSSLTGIYVYWNYDTTVANAGYTQGYRVRLYNQSGAVVKTYYTNNKYYTIPKADIPKMQHTYIDVTPYFANDQSHTASSTYAGSYWYYNGTIAKCPFVVMASKLAKPSITYPINGSNWINTKFRVCFQLPTDPDKGSELETYHYEDIELYVNGKIFRITSNPASGTSGAIVTSAIWSSTDLTYQKKIVAAPFLASGFPNASSYTLKFRVKKKYTQDKTNWSDWSNTVTISITPAVFNPARGDIIYATHYNNAKATIDRVRKTYGVAWNSPPANVTARVTKILRTQYPYSNWYDRIVATKNQVNNYATFDSGHTNVRFDNTNKILTNFTALVELVTAASNESTTTGTGRNYMKIVYDRCNRLI